MQVESKPTQPLSNNYSTVELRSTLKENRPQYEMPIPQQHNIHKSNEVRKKMSEDYGTVYNVWMYTFFM